MSETVIFLLSAIALLLLTLVVLASGIRAALLRLEQRTSQAPVVPPSAAPEAEAEAAEGGQSAFESFLAEDPARALMSKSEQFAAFREWRRKKGMNWSNS